MSYYYTAESISTEFDKTSLSGSRRYYRDTVGGAGRHVL